ncbi:MAG: four helix bundle protein [Chloroflexi bacterium CG07_land_8_20_14_0_80_51_10]|nr:MAG: four helix bundle protein [Chloroflexi bacterium CG07_land_8_20_14_0_80_51_10]
MTNNEKLKKKSYDLEERTLEFDKGIIRLCKFLPKDTINRELVSQLVRAGGSVGANYREANDALSKKDFIHRMRIMRKEAKECHYWLQLVVETNPEFKNSTESLLKEAEELKKIFSSIIDKSQ